MITTKSRINLRSSIAILATNLHLRTAPVKIGAIDFSDPNFNSDRMTNGPLTDNRRVRIHYLQLSLISGVKSMVFVRLRCIQAESSPILLAT